MAKRLKFKYNDGGRKAARFGKELVGDCVCRAIAIVTGLPYREIHERLSHGNGSQRKSKRALKRREYTADKGITVRRKWFKEYMKELGFKWIPIMGIGTGCKAHLRDGEVPMEGKYIVRVSKHFTSIIDGVIHDTYDPSRGGHRCVYGYYTLADNSKDKGKKANLVECSKVQITQEKFQKSLSESL